LTFCSRDSHRISIWPSFAFHCSFHSINVIYLLWPWFTTRTTSSIYVPFTIKKLSQDVRIRSSSLNLAQAPLYYSWCFHTFIVSPLSSRPALHLFIYSTDCPSVSAIRTRSSAIPLADLFDILR
jgi:hypothetical protein